MKKKYQYWVNSCTYFSWLKAST